MGKKKKAKKPEAGMEEAIEHAILHGSWVAADDIDDPSTIVGQVAAGMKALGATDGPPPPDIWRETAMIHAEVDRLRDDVLTLRAASIRQAEVVSEAVAQVRKFFDAQADGE